MDYPYGVKPGGLTTLREVKLIILFLLKEAGRFVPKETVVGILTDNALANYFDITAALYDLEKLSYTSSDKGAYSLQSSGLEVILELSDELPLSVRTAVSNAVKNTVNKEPSSAVNAHIEQREDGYVVHLSIHDVGSDLLGMSIFMPTLSYAETVRENFLLSPENCYKRLLKLLVGEE